MRMTSILWTLVGITPLALAACSSEEVNTGGTPPATDSGAALDTAAASDAGDSSSGSDAGAGGVGGTGGAGGVAGTGGSGGVGGAGATGGSGGAAVDATTPDGTAGSGGAGGSGGEGGSDGGPGGSGGTGGADASSGDANPDACVIAAGNDGLIADMETTKDAGSLAVMTHAADGRTERPIYRPNITTITTFTTELEGNTSNHVLHVAGGLDALGYRMALEVPVGPVLVCYDATAYAGIKFRLGGTSTQSSLPANTMRVELLVDQPCFVSDPTVDVTMEPTMKEYTLHWSDFSTGDSQPVSLYPTMITTIQFSIFDQSSNQSQVHYDYKLDDIAFIPAGQ